MYVNQSQEQTRHIPTRLKLILAVPVVILICHLLLLIFAGAADVTQLPW